MKKISFASDYMEGAHSAIIERLAETNHWQTSGYGTDGICASAQEKIRTACNAPEAMVQFLIGGTQTNATVIDALLHGYEGVLAADTGHISLHEAGAIEFGGHKVLSLPHKHGKLMAADIKDYLETFHADANRNHMVQPGMVYISQPSEYGTLYSKQELMSIHKICREYHIPLYIDGARLAYALACPENNVCLADMAKLADVFYIGGTKCGALFGEAVVIPEPKLLPHFFTTVKQHGALLAKGRLLGIQFDVLFTDKIYEHIGQTAIRLANRIRKELKEKGYQLFIETPTNQIFIVLGNEQMGRISKQVEFSFWEKFDEHHTVVRLATSWATTEEAVNQLIRIL